MKTELKFKWSNRSVIEGKSKVFYYCHGQGFDVGTQVYYGNSEFVDHNEAIKDQETWEMRWTPAQEAAR